MTNRSTNSGSSSPPSSTGAGNQKVTLGAESGSQSEAPQLAVFQPVGGRAPLDPFLAVSLRQVVEIRDSTELLRVADPGGETLGYVRWRGQPIPVLNPVRWGSAEDVGQTRERLVLLRGASTPKVLAVPIQQFWIEALDASNAANLVAVSAQRRVWKTQCLALIHAPFGESLLIDVDALFRTVVA